MRMPFGKHKGEELSSVPIDYLEWLLTLHDLREPLKRSVSEELQQRQSRRRQRQEQRNGSRSHSSTTTIPTELQPVCRSIIDKGYRLVSQQTHPDHGGEHGLMVLVNKAIEVLREIIK